MTLASLRSYPYLEQNRSTLGAGVRPAQPGNARQQIKLAGLRLPPGIRDPGLRDLL